MSAERCWQCDKDYPRVQLLDIPVFHKRYTIKWCFNCVKKQLKWSDYKLVKKERTAKREPSKGIRFAKWKVKKQ